MQIKLRFICKINALKLTEIIYYAEIIPLEF